MDFREKFIAYVDMLGFKDYVRSAEAAAGKTLPDLLKLLACFDSQGRQKDFKVYGPLTCPCAPCVQKDLDFQVTTVSDCAVLSAEVSPAGVINLVSQCAEIVMRFLDMGAMCRGYVTKGKIYHTSEHLIGSGYHEAFHRESQVAIFKRDADERGTPFVELGPDVVRYVDGCSDQCVRMIFDRLVRREGDSAAIFPFQRLQYYSPLLGPHERLDTERERRSINNVRALLQRLISGILASVDQSNPSALRKAEHYVKALEAQRDICDKSEQMIDMLNSPFPARSA